MIAMMGNMKEREGATLIEVIIYAALLAAFLGVTFAFISSVLGTSDILLERNEVVATSEFVERKLGWIFSGANAVTAPPKGTSSVTLTLGGRDAAVYPATVVGTTTLTLMTAGGGAAALLGNRVNLVSFLAEHLSGSQATSAVRVTVVLRSVVYPYLTVSSTHFYAFP